MTQTFTSYIEIAEALQDRAMEAIKAAGFQAFYGASNVSCSRYIEVRLREGEDEVETFKLRFSDHVDFYGSDHTIRFEQQVEETEDEFGDVDLTLAAWRMDDLVSQALAAVQEAAK